MSKKTIRKADLGLGIPEKPFTKRELAIQESQRKKAIEMAKPVDCGAEDLWRKLKRLEEEVAETKYLLLDYAKQAIKEGYRFESFIYVKESVIPDREAIESWYFNIGKALPRMTKIETDWKLAQKELGKDCPMKKKAAYLREVGQK